MLTAKKKHEKINLKALKKKNLNNLGEIIINNNKF